MREKGMCSICWRVDTMYTCSLCGRNVCMNCIDLPSGLCKQCLRGRQLEAEK
ncbi:MAG: orotate phosphoribosyltransferase [Candidatus Aenigmatarchaeota archaeon]